MGVFSRSWEVTKVTFRVMKKEKELFVFPILSIFFSLLFFIALVLPLFILPLLGGGQDFVFGVLQLILVFFLYFGLAFIATFFNVCSVYTAAQAFANENPKFGSTISFALSKLHLIFLWSIVSATVGLLLKLLENAARKAKGGGRIAASIAVSLLGMAWGIATIFVVPGLVYHNLGPFTAIKKSVQVLKKTWGESLVRYFGLGLAAFLFILPGLLIGGGLTVIGFLIFPVLGAIFFGITFLYILIVALVFGVATQVFNTALYVYAETGHVPDGFSKDLMQNAFKSKSSFFRR